MKQKIKDSEKDGVTNPGSITIHSVDVVTPEFMDKFLDEKPTIAKYGMADSAFFPPSARKPNDSSDVGASAPTSCKKGNSNGQA